MNSENKKSRFPKNEKHKLFKLSALALAIQLASSNSYAGPEGATVTGGSGTITNSGSTTTIDQMTDRMSIDWQSYDVNANERVQYIQPSSSSISLNRILSNSGSQIHGQIDANGHVILMNPHGVVFGAGATVNVGGLLATGLNIESSDFMNGDFAFSALENAEGKVINSGLINAATGGSVTLLGKQVENNGLIVANLGRVNLAAGKQAVVTFDNEGLMGVRITQEVLQDELGMDAAVINSGEILVENGQILLTASVSEDIFSQAVRLEGEAKSAVVHSDGSFTLGGGANVVNTGELNVSGGSSGDAGQLVIIGENIEQRGNVLAEGSGGDIEIHARETNLVDSGTISASSASGAAGNIRLLGENVGLIGDASITASGAAGGGEILIGGDITGANSFVPNSEFTYIGESAVVAADAENAGNGGKVIVFANNSARVYGELSALGGTESGNGGFIETSGLVGFDILSVPNASSRSDNGMAGEWLIDPVNITINGGNAGTIPSTGIFAPTSNSNLGVDVIQSALLNGNVTIRTSSGSGGDGDIDLNANLEMHDDYANRVTLTFDADRNFNLVNGSIYGDRGSSGDDPGLNVVISADGAYTQSSGRDIMTAGGSVEISAASFTMNGNSGDSTSIYSEGGRVAIEVSGAVEIATNNRSARIWAYVEGSNSGGGDISISASSITLGGSSPDSNVFISTRGNGSSINLHASNTITLRDDVTALGGSISISGLVDGTGAITDALDTLNLDVDANVSDTVPATGRVVLATADDSVTLGGKIEIDATNINIQEDTFIRTRTASVTSGDTGDIEVNGAVQSSNASDLFIYGRHISVDNISGLDDVIVNGIGDLTAGSINLSRPQASERNSGESAGTLDITANSINVTGPIQVEGGDGNAISGSLSQSGGDGGEVVINSLTGNVLLNGISVDGGIAEIGGFGGSATGGSAGTITITSAGDIELQGNYTAQAQNGVNGGASGSVGSISFSGSAFQINDAVSIDTRTVGVSGSAGGLTLTGNSINSEAGEANNLSIYADAVAFSGSVGNAQRLGAVEIFSYNEIEFVTNPITANSFLADATGLFTSGNITTGGAEAGNGGDVSITSGSTLSVGDIDTSSNDSANGAVSLYASGAINAGTLSTVGLGSAAGANVVIDTSDTVTTETINASAGTEQASGDGSIGGDITIDGSAITLLGLSANGGNATGNGGSAGQITINATQNGADYGVVIAGDVASTGGAGSTDGAASTTQVVLNSSSAPATVYLGRSVDNSVSINSFFTSDISITGSSHTSDTLYFADITTAPGVSATQWTFGASDVVVQSPGAGVSDPKVTLTSMDVLHAGAGEDIFTFNNSFAGQVFGNAGADTFQVATAGISANVFGHDPLNGEEPGTLDTLQSLLTTGSSDWSIDGSDVDTLDTNFIFYGMESLVGGDGVDDTFTFVNSLDVVEQVAGGTGNDTVDLSNASASPLTVSVGGASNSQDLIISGVETLTGSTTNADILVAAGNTSNRWELTGANDGTLHYDTTLDANYAITASATDQVQFTDFTTLQGGDGLDAFVFAGGTVANIEGGGGSNDVLIANNQANNFYLTSTTSGNLNSSSAPTIDNSGAEPVYTFADGSNFSGLELLLGNDAVDTFIFYMASEYGLAANAIDAGGQTDIVDLTNVSSDAEVTLGSNIQGVLSAEVILGNGGALTVLPSAASPGVDVEWSIGTFSGNPDSATAGIDDGSVSDGTNTIWFVDFADLVGGGENDHFTFASGSALTGLIDGALGANKITMNNAGTVDWQLLADGVLGTGTVLNGQVSYATSGAQTTDFTNILTLAGGTGTHTLTAKNQENYWVIQSNTVQSVSLGSDSSGDGLFDSKGSDEVFFTGMDTLYGNEGIDQFEASQIFTLAIYGEGDSHADTASDVFTLLTATENFWQITADETGSVNEGSAADTPAISFNDFEVVNAPDDVADTFEMGFTSAPTMLINAGSGTPIDSVTYSVPGDISIGVSAAGADSGLLGIERVTGNGVGSQIYAVNTGLSEWSLSSTQNSVTIGGVETEFSGFSEVTGGVGSDNFTIADRGEVQNIDGGDDGSASTNRILAPGTGAVFVLDAGGNSVINADGTVSFVDAFSQINAFTGTGSELDASSYGQAISVDLDTNSTTSTFALDGVISVIGDSSVENSFYAADDDNVWQITGADSGSVGGVSFENFSTLTGGASDDTFTLGASGSISNEIDGGGDNDTGGDGDVIVGRDEDTWWYITGTNAGFVNTLDGVDSDVNVGNMVNTFTNITGLSGGAADDTFVVRSGSIAGARGGAATTQDTLSYEQAAGPVLVTLSSATGVGSFSEIEQYRGNNTNSTLAIADSVSSTATWQITGENDGNVEFTGISDAILFENFNNISGGNNTNDTFTLAAAGRVTGALSGGTGGTDTITGPDAGGHFVVSGAESYVLVSEGSAIRRVQEFSDIETLTGGTGSDTFNIASNFVGTVNGGAGTNELLVTSGSGNDVDWIISGENSGSAESITFTDMQTLTGGDGNDSFALQTGGSVATLVAGGLGTNAITGPAAASRFVITATEQYVEQISDSSRLIADFSDISVFTGGIGNDEFSVAAGQITGAVFNGGGGTENRLTIASGSDTDVSWVVNSANGGSVASNTFSGMQELEGGDGSDSYSITSTAAAVEIFGGAQDTDDNGDTLSLDHDVATAWNIDGTSNTVGSVTFEQIETLQGSRVDDTFDVSVNAVDRIDGRAGNDIFNIADTSVAVDFIGGSQTGGDGDELVLTHGDVAEWSIPAPVTSRNTVVSGVGVSQGTSTFEGIETVRGSDGGVDTFNISDSSVALYEGRGGDDIFTVLSSTVAATLVGGGDTVSVGDTLTLQHSTTTSWNITGGTTHTAGSLSFSDIEVAEGSNGADTFTIASSDVAQLYGRGGNDFFEISSADVTVEIIGGSHATNGADEIDLSHSSEAEWHLTGDTVETVVANPDSPTGTVSFSGVEIAHGSQGSDVFQVASSNLTTIYGDAGGDTFNVALNFGPAIFGDSKSGASAGTDVLVLNHSTDVNWTIDADPSVSNGSTTLNFAGIETARGSAGNDQFTVTAASVNLLEGGSGADTFIINQSGLAFGINGRGVAATDATDTLTLGNSYTENSSWVLTDSTSTLEVTSGSGAQVSFQNIDTVNGGAGNDTFDIRGSAVTSIFGLGGNDSFTLENAGISGVLLNGGVGTNSLAVDHTETTLWTIDTALNGGNTINVTGTTDVEFSNMSELYGAQFDAGGGIDTFHINTEFTGDIDSRSGADVINVNAAVSGTIDGGTGGDTFNIFASVNNGISDSFDILGGNGADIFWLQSNSVETRISGGLSDADTLHGYTTDTTWTIDSTSTVATGSVSSSFIAIENLVGRNAVADTFVLLDGSPLSSLDINAGAADGVVDSLDFSNYSLVNNRLDITSSLVSDLVINIERVIGNNTQGLAATSTTGSTVNWILQDIDGSGSAENEGSVGAFQFIGFNSLYGGDGNDLFTFNGGTLTGNIDGSGGTNTVARAADTGDTTWSITDTNIGRLTGLTGEFSNIDVLSGNNNNDTFVFIDTTTGGPSQFGSWSGQIIGGDGLGIDVITSNKLQASNWNISGSGAGSVDGWLTAYSGIEQLNGAQEYVDTFTVTDGGRMLSINGGTDAGETINDILNADNSALVNTWLIDRDNGGSLSSGEDPSLTPMIDSFDSIETLIGASGKDIFIAQDVVSLRGTIYGENPAGYAAETNNLTDTLDLTGFTGRIVVVVGSGETGEDQGDGFTKVSVEITETDPNNTSQVRELRGTASTTVWQITGLNEITIPGEDEPYTGFQYLVGHGNASDSFEFAVNGALTGGITGGTGTGTDTIVGFGHALETPWNITATGSGTSTINSEVFTFSQIENIVGGSGPDAFTIESASNATIALDINAGNGANRFDVNTPLSGSLTSGTGIDTLLINAPVTGVIDSGNGSDVFTIATSLESMTLIAGGGSNDVLTIDYDAAATWVLDDTTGWTVSDDGLDGSISTLTISGFETFNGSNREDFVTFNDSSFGGVFSGRGGADQFSLATDAMTFTLHGEDGVSPSSANDSVTNTHTEDATWVLASDGSSVATSAGEVTLSGIDSVIGGSGRDDITVSVAMDSVNGGSGVDEISIGAAIANGVSGGEGADRIFVTADNLVFTVDGGSIDSEIDELIGFDTINTWQIRNVGTSSLLNGETGNITVMGFESLTGGSQQDTFEIGATLAGTVQGMGGGDIFRIAAGVLGDILGGTGDDQFTIEQNTFALAIDAGGGGNDTLIYSVANATTNQWLITNENEGSVSNEETITFEGVENIEGSASSDYFTINDNISGEIRGSGGSNTYLFTNSGITTYVVGGTNADTIQVDHTDGGLWTNISGTQEIVDGSATPGTITFSEVETFIAGNGEDVFNIGNATSRVETNGGNDWVTTSVAITNGVDLGEDNDTIEVTSANLSFEIDGGDPDTANSTGGDTFIGFDADAQWLVGGTNSGTYTNNRTDFITFTNIENLTGGDGNDTYTINSGAVLNGVIDGGGNTQQIANPNAPDFDNDIFGDEIIATALVGANTFVQEDTYSGGGHYSFANVERLSVTAQTGVGNYDTIQSGNGVNSWVINGSNQGLLINEDTGATTYFTGFQNVQGGLGVDQFALQGNNSNYIDGQIHGGSGSAIDTIDYSLVDEAVTVQLGSVSGGIADVEGVTGYREGTVGANHQRILIGVGGADDSEISVWTISDFDGASVAADGINDGEFMRAGETYQFTNFNTLVGHDNSDQFVIAGSGRLTGGVIGGGGTNTLNATGLSGNFSAQVTDASVADLSNINPTDGIVQMSGISTVSANGNFNNTLYAADDSANAWQISSPDSGTLNSLIFNSFGNLIGGNAQDTFVFTTATTLSGLIDGNGGAIDSVDATALNDNQVVLIGSDAPGGVTPDLQIANVETITLNGTGNELVGDLTNRTWAISGNNAGTITRTGASTPETSIEFSGFGSLRGNAADDTFVVAGSDRLSGTVVGGAGQDSLDLSAVTVGDGTLTVAVNTSPVAEADFTVSEFESLTGSTSATNVLAASDQVNNWQITGSDAGSLNETLVFTRFASLLGGDNIDTFTFVSTNGSEGALSGYLDGGAQPADTSDTVNMAALGTVDIQLGGANGMVNIERYIGNNSNSRLRSQNGTNTWEINAENSGTLNGNVRFEQFNYLHGGTDTDNFLVSSSGSVTGEIDAGEGADTLTLTLAETSQGTLRFNGGAASDTISVLGGGDALVAEFSPETLIAGESELEYRNESANTEYQLLFSATEQISDAVTANRLIVNDTSQADAITLNSASVAISGFPSLNYSNKDSLEIDASADDTVTVANTVSLAEQLVLRNAAVEAGNNAQVNANTLVLDSVGVVGSGTNRLNIDAANLMIQSAANAIYLQDSNQLNIAELSSSGVVDIVANGSITDSAGLVMQGAGSELLVQSRSGSVLLDNANTFGGSLSVVADEQAHINSTGRLSLAQLTAQSATLSAGGNIDAFGPVMVERSLSLDAAGNLEMINAGNQLGSIAIVSADNANIADSNMLAIAEATVSGAFSTQSQGLQVNGAVQTESLDFNSGGASTTVSGVLTSSGDTRITANGIDVLAAVSGRGVTLDAGSGNVDQQAQIRSATGDITITGNLISQSAELLSDSDISLTAASGFEQNSAITAAGNVDVVVNDGSIAMSGNTLTTASGVNYTAANNLTIARMDAATANLTAGGSMDVNGSVATSGDTVISAQTFAMGNNAQLSTGTNLNLSTSANADLGAITAANTLTVAAGGTLSVNEMMQTNTLLLSGNSGVQVDANLSGAQQVMVESSAGNVNLRANVASSAGAVSVSANGDLVMSQSSEVSVTGDNSLTLSSGADLSVATLSAGAGDIILNSGGELVDQTSESTIVGESLVISATSGVRGATSDNVFNADVANLWLNNYGNSVAFTNQNDLNVRHLGNNGDILLRVLNGDIVLDNTTDNTYVGGDDPALAGGVSNANYNIGDLTLLALSGRIVASGGYNNSQPDIVAENATLLARQYGTPARALLYYVKNALNIDAELLAGVSYGSAFYRGIRPAIINDQSNRRPGMFDNYSNGGEQLVEVEELVEIDPAIFTAVSNYFFDEVSIRLPNDQLYEDELEELAAID